MNRGVTLDAEALIALDLGSRRILALLARAQETSVRITVDRRGIRGRERATEGVRSTIFEIEDT